MTYQTHDSWSRTQRVVAKAEHLAKGSNPRFIVTLLTATTHPARALYEELYCARGEMENKIKEQQRFLFAYRTSCHTLRANQIRLLLSTFAYVLLRAVREHGLRETELARAQFDTLRLRLLKLGGLITLSVRRVLVRLATAYPLQQLFQNVAERLQALPPFVGPQPTLSTATRGLPKATAYATPAGLVRNAGVAEA